MSYKELKDMEQLLRLHVEECQGHIDNYLFRLNDGLMIDHRSVECLVEVKICVEQMLKVQRILLEDNLS